MSTSSIFKIRTNDDLGEDDPFRVILDAEDKIIVEVSLEMKEGYEEIAAVTSAGIHGSIVLPALAEAIRRREEFEDTMWSGRLTAMLGERDIDPTHPIEAAQELLKNPVSRMATDVKGMEFR
jgi:hypothetical protein